MQVDTITAHKYSSNNKESIQESKTCGCFYCLKIFSSEEITSYLEKENTAICPDCSVDSIICDKDVKFDKDFLQKMKDYWFGSR